MNHHDRVAHPCPPDREHSYFFRLYALDVKLGSAKIASRRDLETAMKGHMIEPRGIDGQIQSH